ncbi:hypothetical protein ABIE13_004379 [Ottowia thiooxydans]|uniref:Uncharacterized protein n=1 Tax=Ottowia thiooxydans TaxID=219182 RepID=A0ABV2QDY7_9BURK
MSPPKSERLKPFGTSAAVTCPTGIGMCSRADEAYISVAQETIPGTAFAIEPGDMALWLTGTMDEIAPLLRAPAPEVLCAAPGGDFSRSDELIGF